MPEKYIARLQRVQNCLERVVTKAPRFSSSFPILKLLEVHEPDNFSVPSQGTNCPGAYLDRVDRASEPCQHLQIDRITEFYT